MRADRPEIDEHSRPYWDAAKRGTLLLRSCRDCARSYHYPRPFCPYCWSEDVTWVEASGRATLYAYSVVHRNDLPPWDARLPYVAAVVELAEGPRMSTNVVGCPPGRLTIGMALRLDFRDDGELAVPVFRPA